MSATPKEAPKAEKKEEVKKPDVAAEKAEAKVDAKKEGKDEKVEGVKADTSAKVAEAAKVAEPEKEEKKDAHAADEHAHEAHPPAHAAKPRTGKVSYGLAKPVVAANDNKEKAGEDPHPGFLKRWFWSPDGFLRSFLRPVGATLKTLWTSAKTTATLGAGIAPIPWASKWVRKHYKGADIVELKPLVKKQKAEVAAHAAPHAPADAAHAGHPPEGDHAKPHTAEEKHAA